MENDLFMCFMFALYFLNEVLDKVYSKQLRNHDPEIRIKKYPVLVSISQLVCRGIGQP